MTEHNSSPPSTPSHVLLRAIQVRFRFVFALGLLAAMMAGWPWLRGGWDRVSALWHRHSPAASVSGDREFFCPMDPGVVSAWPAICPVCNMDLITRKKSDATLLPEGVLARMQFTPYRIQLAGIRTSPVKSQAAENQSVGVVSVPVSAVVQLGDVDVVYVESMPGMFDGTRVKVGQRDGETCQIVEGLKPEQRVATMGVFLIDAESRLHPNLATQYFGAASSSNRSPDLPQRRSATKKSAEPLSDADLALVKRQRICPVTEAPLGSMGTPVFAMVRGRKVFLCCAACESGLKADPDKYLAKLKEERDDNRQ